MSGTFFDATDPRFDDPGVRAPRDLPHGLVTPPPEVVARVDRERASFPPMIFTDDYAKRILDDATLAYYFEGRDVAYRSVPEGVEVLAVGLEEISRYLADVPAQQRSGVRIRQA